MKWVIAASTVVTSCLAGPIMGDVDTAIEYLWTGSTVPGMHLSLVKSSHVINCILKVKMNGHCDDYTLPIPSLDSQLIFPPDLHLLLLIWIIAIQPLPHMRLLIALPHQQLP
jgi:hypothetical protein